MQGETPAKKPATTPITMSSATSRCSLCQMRCSWAATWGSWAIGMAATRNIDPRPAPAGRFTPYIASEPRVAIQAAGEDPGRRCELAAIGNGRARWRPA